MDQTTQENLESFFRQRATGRMQSNDADVRAFCAAHPYEVFVGLETRRVRDREPAFTTLEEAQRWARGRSDGGDWRIRSSITGELVTAATYPGSVAAAAGTL